MNEDDFNDILINYYREKLSNFEQQRSLRSWPSLSSLNSSKMESEALYKELAQEDNRSLRLLKSNASARSAGQKSSESLRYGPNHNRSCTDVICLLFFIIFIVAWAFMIYFFSTRINFEATLHPSNSYGEICGKGSQSSRPYLAFFNIFQCVASPELSIVEGCKTPQICVQECPSHTFSINKLDPDSVRQKQADLALCLPNVVPTAQTILKLADEGKCARYYFNSEPIGGRCLPSVVKLVGGQFILDEISKDTMQFNNGSNISQDNLIHNNQIMSSLMGALNIGIKAVKDIAKTWRWILIGLVEVVVVTIIWIYFLQHAAFIMTWITIISLLALNGAGLYFSFEHYKSYDIPTNHTVQALVQTRSNLAASNPNIQFRSMNLMEEDLPVVDYRSARYLKLANDDLKFELNLMDMLKDNLNDFLNKQSTWKWISIILAVTLAILLLTVFCLVSRIRLACAVIQESGKAVMQLKSTLFFPIVPFIFYLACCAGAAVAIVIISAGTHSNYRYSNGTLCSPVELDDMHYKEIGVTQLPNASRKNVDTPTDCKLEATPFERRTVYGAHALNIFAILWIMYFLSDLCFATLSGTFSMWYWTFSKTDVPFFSLLVSFKNVFVYHLGSIAFGSFIITVIRFIRIVLEYIDKKCKSYADYQVVKWVLCVCKCCFWCLEVFIRFINRNAYIYMAMYGTSFLTSAREAFAIIAKNPVRAFVLNYLSELLLFISKVVVTAIVGVNAYFLLTNQFPSVVVFDLQYYWAPLGAFIFLSYILAGALFGVYNVAIETIFFCYLKDSEDNDGSEERPYYMSKGLAKVFGTRNKRVENRE